MSVALCVMTDGRRDLISRTIPSVLDNLRGPVSELVICDDSADEEYSWWLSRTYTDFDIVSGPTRLGFGGNIQRAWAYLRENSRAKHLFITEDDFLFHRPVHLSDMATVLDTHPNVCQLVLKRQPWNAEEKAAGGIIEQHPEDYTQRSDGRYEWVEHRRFWSTNPYLARRSLILTHDWPSTSESEGRFTHELLAKYPDILFAFWGNRNDPPWVEHTGHVRTGLGY